MADGPINLNRFRKRKQREEAARRAAENRAQHGRTGAERAAAEREEARKKRFLEGHRADDPADRADDEGAPD